MAKIKLRGNFTRPNHTDFIRDLIEWELWDIEKILLNFSNMDFLKIQWDSKDIEDFFAEYSINERYWLCC